jgi:hypothetical protein
MLIAQHKASRVPGRRFKKVPKRSHRLGLAQRWHNPGDSPIMSCVQRGSRQGSRTRASTATGKWVPFVCSVMSMRPVVPRIDDVSTEVFFQPAR